MLLHNGSYKIEKIVEMPGMQQEKLCVCNSKGHAQGHYVNAHSDAL